MLPSHRDVPRAGARGTLHRLGRLALAGSLLACAMPSSETPAATPAPATTGGRWVEGTHDEGAGRARPWRLWVPRGHDARRPAPLVVLLHGCTQDAADVARGARIAVQADAAHALVLLPEQPTWAHPRRCWNWYEPAHQARDAGEPAAIAAITREVQAAHGADPARTTVAGISAGGAMALIASAAHPDLYAGVAVHSALAPTAARTVAEALAAMQGGSRDATRVSGEALLAAMGPRARAVPLLALHGAADRIVAPRNAMQLVAQAVAARGALLPDEAPFARDSTWTEGGRRVTRSTFAHGAIEQWIVEGLGHAWSGGSTEGTFTDAAGPDATAIMLRFLLAQRLAVAAPAAGR